MRSRHQSGLPRLLLLVALAAAVLLALVFASSVTAASPSASPAREVVYRYGQLEPVESLNPLVGTSGIDYQVYLLAYDMLNNANPKDMSSTPAFAESWSHSADGKVWTFKIRHGMTWSDGRPATARDVAFTFNYVIKNQVGNYLMYVNHIKSVVADDDYTARFICDAPKADILKMGVYILPEHVWSKVPVAEATKTYRNGPPTISSGPFRVVESKPTGFTKLVANKQYWRGRPGIDQLLIEVYTNEQSMVNDLRSGALDAVTGVPEGLFPSLTSAPGITTNRGTSWSMTQISLNCYTSPHSKGNPVLRDQAFRQALQYAVDRQAIAKTAFNTYADVGEVLLPPYSRFAWQPPAADAYAFDPEGAKTMLDAAGYRDVDGDGYRETKQGKALALRLYSGSDMPPDVAASRLAVGMFKDVGIKVSFQVFDQATLTARIWNYSGNNWAPDYDMFLYWWLGGSDPQFMLSLPTTEQIGGWSDTGWTNPRYDELYLQQSTEIDEQKRIALVQEMQQIVHQASPYIILNYPQRLEAYRTDKWEGYVAAPSAMKGTDGAVISGSENIDTFLKLHPKTAATTTQTGSNSWIYGVIAAVAVAVAVAIWLVLRRRGRAVEEE
jgi:peptide/nickel transport system substrate-binding protein